MDETSGESISLRGLTKRFTRSGPAAVSDVDLDIAAGEFVSFLGPSGSGKTTTLSLVAGFEQPTTGSVRIGARDVSRLAAHRRDLGVVFQSYALFPHLTVAQNVAFPLRQRGVSRSRTRETVARVLETVDLRGLATRRPGQLSGGQQQRVALARAIAFEPGVLLLDEPLSALDKRLRDAMQMELRRLHRDLGSTFVFVTHDQEEALALSDRIVVFNHGRIEQVGTGDELYERPASIFIADFLGESTQFRGRPVPEGDETLIDGLPGIRARGRVDSGTDAAIIVRPEHLRLAALTQLPTLTGVNTIRVRVTDQLYLGSTRKVGVLLPNGELGLVREPTEAPSRVSVGDEALMWWPVDRGVLLPVSSS